MGVLRVYDGSEWVGLPVSTDHGTFSGLGDDDHTQYLLADGTRAMAGNLNMGDNEITSASKLTVGDTTAASSVVIVALQNSTASPDVYAGPEAPTHVGVAGDLCVVASGTESTVYVNQGSTNWEKLIRESDPQASRGFAAGVFGAGAVTTTATLTYTIFASGTIEAENGFTFSDTGSNDYYDDIVWQGGRTACFSLSLKCTAKSSAATAYEMRVIPYTYDGTTETAVTSTIVYASTPPRNNSKNSGAVAGTLTLNHGDSVRFKHSNINSTAGKIDSYGIAAVLTEIFSTED